MSKISDDSRKVRWLPYLIGVIILWAANTIFAIYYFPKPEQIGQFGDMFGAVNSLFAGLAFAGVIFAIILQKKELELQRQELKGQKEQLQAQDRTLQKQNFENSFFQLLSFHNEIVNSLEAQDLDGQEVEGRRCFDVFFKRLAHIYKPETNTSGQMKDSINTSYEEFLSRYQWIIGRYFRHLYNTVKFVHEHKFIKDLEDKRTYTNLIRAQLSSNELELLFYNCLSDRGAKFKHLVEKYALLEDMDFRKLLDPEHRSLYTERAYGGSSRKENQ